MADILFTSAAKVSTFLMSENPGQRLIYAIGQRLPALPPKSIAMLRKAYNRGEIDLVQRRCPNGFEYIASKRWRPVEVYDHGKFMPQHLVHTA